MRQRMRRLSGLAVFPALMTAAACGSGEGGKRDGAEGRILPYRSDVAFADRYYLADEACQTTGGNAAVGAETQIWQWNGTAAAQKPLGIAGVASGASLRGPGIAATVYNLHQRTSCAQGDGEAACDDAGEIVTPPQNLRICQPKTVFPRTSVEGVALASLANLAAARQFYDKVPGAGGMTDTHLVVLPTLETVKGQGRAVATDNLAYSPDFRGAPVFVIFPKGKRSLELGRWEGVNLWEIPWGLAHEFGHHVFRIHSQIDEGSLLGAAPLRPIHAFDGGAPGSGGLTLAGGGADVLGAVNEGFADLFAYYTHGGKAGLTDRLDCFAQNRDVAAARFADGTPKTLTREALAIFAGQEKGERGNCDVPSYDDIHIVGAVVAYGVERLFSAGAAGADPAKKAAQLLAWSASMGQKVKARPAVARDLEALVGDAVKLAAQSGKLNAAQCRALREVFPAYAASWLGGSLGVSCSPT